MQGLQKPPVLYLSFERVHHLDKHQSPFYCCLARFLVTVHGSTFVSLADILAAARAGTRSKCCPQRSADISKCKPSKAVVMLTWRGGVGWGGGAGGLRQGLSASLTFREKVNFSDF